MKNLTLRLPVVLTIGLFLMVCIGAVNYTPEAKDARLDYLCAESTVSHQALLNVDDPECQLGCMQIWEPKYHGPDYASCDADGNSICQALLIANNCPGCGDDDSDDPIE